MQARQASLAVGDETSRPPSSRSSGEHPEVEASSRLTGVPQRITSPTRRVSAGRLARMQQRMRWPRKLQRDGQRVADGYNRRVLQVGAR